MHLKSVGNVEAASKAEELILNVFKCCTTPKRARDSLAEKNTRTQAINNIHTEFVSFAEMDVR